MNENIRNVSDDGDDYFNVDVDVKWKCIYK